MNVTLSDGHIYTDETRTVWPGVTSILKDVGIVDDRFFDDYSRDRGKAVHLATALYDRDELDEDSVDPIIRPYLDSWIRFREESGFVPDLIEQIVWNENFRYAGTLDRAGVMNGKSWVIDIKSGVVQQWTAIQISGYNECLTSCHQRGAVELHDNGTYKLIEYNDNRQDKSEWYACLVLRNWKKNNNLK